MVFVVVLVGGMFVGCGERDHAEQEKIRALEAQVEQSAREAQTLAYAYEKLRESSATELANSKVRGSAIWEEVMERLGKIEEMWNDAEAADRQVEEMIEMLRGAEEDFNAKLEEALKRNEEKMRTLEGIEPRGAFRSADEMVNALVQELLDAQQEVARLRAKLAGVGD